MKKLFVYRILSNRRRIGVISLLSMIIVTIVAGIFIFYFDELEKKHAFRVDYSFNRVTNKSSQTDQILSELASPVHVYALFTPGREDLVLIGLLERYAAATNFFTFSAENLLANPSLIQHISSNLDDAAVSTDCLIVHGLEKDRIRILNFSDFVSQAYDNNTGQFYISGLTYEQSLSDAVIFVTSPESASIQVLAGHGELRKEDVVNMSALLTKYNYVLDEVNLLHGKQLDPKKLLMILSPTRDITQKQLGDIMDFSRLGGALLITTNFSHYDPLPNFDSLLRSFGFHQKKGLVITIEEEPESYYNSPAILIPYMESAEPTANMIENNQTTLILAGSSAFSEPSESNTNIRQYVVLRSGNAYLRDTSDGSNNVDKRPDDEISQFPLAILSERFYDHGVLSKAFVIGNTSVFTDSWLYQNTYSSEFLLNLVNYLSPTKASSISIPAKEAIRPPLRITNYMFNYLLLVLLPLMVAAVGASVLLSRKKR